MSGDVIIVDDMVDTAGTLQALSNRLKAAGAKNIYLCASHGLFTSGSNNIIESSPVNKVFVSDSLPLPVDASKKIEQVSIANQLGHLILTEHFRSITFEEEEFDIEE